MSVFTRKYIAVVDSSTRTSGTSSNFQVRIDLPIDNKYNRVILLSAIVPKSYYLIQAGYNTFTLREGAAYFTITIPIGNYSITELLLSLNTLLNAISGIGQEYVVTYSKLTGKLTFTIIAEVVNTYLIFTTNLFDTLGFDKNSTNVFTSSTLVSTNVVNLNPYECLYIRSDMTANSYGTILDIVPMCMSPNYSFVYYQNTTDHTQKELVGNHNTTFTFTVTDNQNRIVDLNGKDITFTLCLHRDTREITEDLTRENILIKNQEAMVRASENSLNGVPIANKGSVDESIYSVGWER